MDIVKQISYAMSLRDPQREALEVLHNISSTVEYKTATKAESEAAASAHSEGGRKIKVADEFSFPSFCFEMATGIGKTRLMGASIYYLYKTKGYKHFFILAPGDTIYEKLKKESRPEHPKYLFKGLEAELGARPKVYDGENYLQYNSRQIEAFNYAEIQIFIFNIGKIFTRGDVTFKFHRYQETLGMSFADILAGFDDLVICMDEAHRYYAPASMKAIDYLKPVLGLEFTATPKSKNNVIYSYDLAKGAGKFLKIPVMNGRTNLAGYNDADVQEMKLMDGMRLHENRKRTLYQYCTENDLPYVKPIVLVSCKDTTHAAEVGALIASDDFCEGRYKHKVIEIHSGSGSAEAEENIAKLLTVENNQNPVEIVLHVYKLKEGWDVNNLFTIIPLNAAKSEILAMQTIGRGLRLPFGYITGNPEIDTLDIVAHEHYREIVEELKANPTFRTRDLDQEKPEPTKSITITPGFDDRQLSFLDDLFVQTGVKRMQDLSDPLEQAKIYEAYIRSVTAKPTKKTDSTPQITLFDYMDTTDPTSKPTAETPKPDAITAPKANIPTKEEFSKRLDRMGVTGINVPRILISPSSTMTIRRLVVIKRTIKDFAIESSKIERYDVVNNNLLDSFDAAILEDPNPVNTLACMLLDAISEFDADDADLVLDVVKQYLSQIEGDDAEKRKIIRRYAVSILEDIKAQVQAAMDIETRIVYKVQKEMILFGKVAKTIKPDGEVSLYKDIPDKRNIRRYAFTGFKKSYYAVNSFDSDDERRMAIVLEEDPDVLKWIKPPLNQMGIFYKPGAQYTPDFLVETKNEKFMIEVKGADSLTDVDVLQKKHEGEEWCKYASMTDADGKKWHYRLIDGGKIQTGSSLNLILSFATDIVG